MLPSTADPIEVLWTLAALLGLLGAVGVAAYAWGDWRGNLAHPQADPAERARRHLVASTVLRNRCINVFLQAALVIVGIRAMLLPTNPASTDSSAFLVGLLFLAVSLAVSVGAVLDLIGRYRFRHLEARQKDRARR